VFHKVLGICSLAKKILTCAAELSATCNQSLRFRVKALLRLFVCLQLLASSHRLGQFTIFSICRPVVLYGCETWSLTLREKRRLRVFENRVLRRVFGPKRDEVTGEWRKLHNKELNNLYSLPSIVRVVK
jgi:hypothetical protein